MEGEFGAKNTAELSKSIEILSILQARTIVCKNQSSTQLPNIFYVTRVFTCNREVASLNEFREFFGLHKHRTSKDIIKD